MSMDEVAVATTGPVKTTVTPPPKPVEKPRPAGTFLNFFLMMPFAAIVLVQAFFFGRAIGGYTAFPFYTIHSFVMMGALGILMLIIQVFQRSILYSTFFGLALVAGIFNAWFGDFWHPVLGNVKEVLTILKSSYARRDVPYPILMTTAVTVLFFGIGAVNFFASLFVKYFFEVIFGSEWSDGRRSAYITAIILMLGVHGGFHVWSSGQVGAGPAPRIQWSAASLYRPMEEYCSRIPTGAQFGPGYVWEYDPNGFRAFNSETGAEIRRQDLGAALLATNWTRTDTPWLPTRKALVGYDKDLLKEMWTCPFPEKLASLPEMPPEEDVTDLGVPLLLRSDVAPGMVLALFDFGQWGAISVKDGKFLWIRPLDAPTRVNRLFLDELLTGAFIVADADRLTFSCNNGHLVSVKRETGETVWEYQHKEAKYSGKGQRAYLTLAGDRILAAFPSGGLVLLDAARGTVISEAKSNEWHPAGPATYDGDSALFLSQDGHLFWVQVDGGAVRMKYLLAENRLPLMPVPMDLRRGFVGYKETLYRLATATRTLETVCSFPKRTLAVTPLFDESLLYIGTQDGWVIALHKESFHEKWRVHVGGELSEDSFALGDKGLLVRTRSGSLYQVRRGAE